MNTCTWRNIWRNGRRTGIAAIAIMLGLLLLVFMDGLYGGYDEAVFANAVRLYGGNLQVHLLRGESAVDVVAQAME